MSDGYDTEPPEWIREYYDGDVPSIAEDPSGPIAIEGADLAFDDLSFDTVNIGAERIAHRIDLAIRGAIRAGYDGIDINYAPMNELARQPLDELSLGPDQIVPWHRPEPDGANGYRTERYTWDWFSDDELARIMTDDALARRLVGEASGVFES